MLGSKNLNKKFWLAASAFIAIGCVAVVNQQPLWLLVSIILVSLPYLFKQAIDYTESLFWLLIIVLPLSTELNITPSLGIDLPDEFLLLLLTFLFIAKAVYTPSFLPIEILKNPLFLIVVLQLCWLIICTIFSSNILLSTKYVLAKVWFIIPFVIVPQIVLINKNRFKKLALCFLLPMLFVVVQCLFRHALTGFSFDGIKQTLSPFFRNHVNYSAMLVCLLAVLWCVKTLTPKTSSSQKYINIGLSIGLVALFFAYSRGAWVAFFAGAFAGFVIRKKLMAKAIVTTLFCLFLIIGWLSINNHYLRFAPNFEQTIYHDDLSDHLKSTTSFKDLSNAERFYRWVGGANMLTAKPITGFGPNTFYSNYKNYTVSQFKTYVSNNPEHSSVHNYFLLLALEQGVVGLLLFCVLVFGMLMQIQHLYHNLQDRFYKKVSIATGVIIVMILAINCTSDMIETDKIGSLFWLSLGIIIILYNKQKREMEERIS